MGTKKSFLRTEHYLSWYLLYKSEDENMILSRKEKLTHLRTSFFMFDCKI